MHPALAYVHVVGIGKCLELSTLTSAVAPLQHFNVLPKRECVPFTLLHLLNQFLRQIDFGLVALLRYKTLLDEDLRLKYAIRHASF